MFNDEEENTAFHSDLMTMFNAPRDKHRNAMELTKGLRKRPPIILRRRSPFYSKRSTIVLRRLDTLKKLDMIYEHYSQEEDFDEPTELCMSHNDHVENHANYVVNVLMEQRKKDPRRYDKALSCIKCMMKNNSGLLTFLMDDNLTSIEMERVQ